MSQNRRTFIKEAAIAGAAAACTVPAGSHANEAAVNEYADDTRCPFFDQPMTCGGPDENGVYRCDC